MAAPWIQALMECERRLDYDGLGLGDRPGGAASRMRVDEQVMP
jgi:hypothetical protein